MKTLPGTSKGKGEKGFTELQTSNEDSLY